MGADLDAAHIYVSREQACALAGVGKMRWRHWLAMGEIPTYLIKPADGQRTGRLPTVYRLADVYAAKQRARAAA